MNLSEVRVWMILKKSRTYSFRRQHTLGNIIVDFCSTKKKLVIEVDGITHENKIGTDAVRDVFLTSLGFRVLRVVGMVPFPDEPVTAFLWTKIHELESGTEDVIRVRT